MALVQILNTLYEATERSESEKLQESTFYFLEEENEEEEDPVREPHDSSGMYKIEVRIFFRANYFPDWDWEHNWNVFDNHNRMDNPKRTKRKEYVQISSSVESMFMSIWHESRMVQTVSLFQW